MSSFLHGTRIFHGNCYLKDIFFDIHKNRQKTQKKYSHSEVCFLQTLYGIIIMNENKGTAFRMRTGWEYCTLRL